MSYYRVYKLENKQDIIAERTKDDYCEEVIKLKSPMIILEMKSPAGDVVIDLKKYSPLSDKDEVLTIPSSRVITSYAPCEELKDYYLTMLELCESTFDPHLKKDMVATTEYIRSFLDSKEEFSQENIIKTKITVSPSKKVH